MGVTEVVVPPGGVFPDSIQTLSAAQIAAAEADTVELHYENVLEEANRIAGQDRSRDYGHPLLNHERIARYWTDFLANREPGPLKPREVALMMILLKVAREQHTPKRDSLVDIAGYVKCVEMMDSAQ